MPTRSIAAEIRYRKRRASRVTPYDMAQLLRYTANDPTGLAKTLAENSKHRKEFWTTVVSVLRFYLTD